MIEKRYTGIASQGADVVANGVYDSEYEYCTTILDRIEVNGTKYKTLNRKKVEIHKAHFEDGVFYCQLQDIADSGLPVFIYNITSGVWFEVRFEYEGDNLTTKLTNDCITANAGDMFNSFGIGGDYENVNYFDFMEGMGVGEGDDILIEYYNHYSSTYYEF